MQTRHSIAVLTAAIGMVVCVNANAVSGNTRAPADTPQDRASDRRKPLEEQIADQTKREEKAKGGTAGAYEGRTGGTPQRADPRVGESGSGGAQAGDLGASKGGADNAQQRPRSGAKDRGAPAQRRDQREAPENP